MLRSGTQAPAAPMVVALLAGLGIAACSPSPSNPASGGASMGASESPARSASASGAPSAGASAGVAGSRAPSASLPTPTPPPLAPGPPASVEPFTPPPAMEPIDDGACLALAARADVEGALGLDVGNIRAEGTDPNTALTCTYPASSGYLLIATTTGDASAFDAERDAAIAYGQTPQAVGVGDRAFYAARTADAPEQVTFVEGPILVRLWNHTPATIGRPDFVTLANGVAAAIHGEIPPAP